MKAKIFPLACILIMLSLSSLAQTDTAEKMNRDRFDYKTDTLNMHQADSLYYSQSPQAKAGQAGDTSRSNGAVMQKAG